MGTKSWLERVNKYKLNLFTMDTVQGAKKINFTACPSGKLSLTSTSPKVIFTSPKNFFREQNEKNINQLFLS